MFIFSIHMYFDCFNLYCLQGGDVFINYKLVDRKRNYLFEGGFV